MGCGIRSEASSAPCPAGGSPDGAPDGHAVPRQAMATPATARVHTHPAGSHVCASPRPDLYSLGSGPSLPPRGDTCARGARPAPPAAEHGLLHPRRSGSEHPPARAPPQPPSPGSCHLPRPPRRPSAPAAAPYSGGRRGRERPGEHSPRDMPLPPPPRSPRRLPRVRLHLGAEARPLGAARAPPPALGRHAGSGSPSWPPRPLRPAAPQAGPQVPKVLAWSLGFAPLHGPRTQGLVPLGQEVAGSTGARVS